MPLVRFEVKNEYKLGAPELYKDAVEREDPKAILDGVAVAGLVGLLRQLGDLAEFAGDVFHGLQEQVISTASRSQRLMTRLQHVEAALPAVEKAVLSQTSHIHFAYTPGFEWHPRIRDEQNHFIYNELPRCIMDSYEECKEPPRLQLLDRFDTGGPGSCLKRYSDPTFFRKASGSMASLSIEKSRKDRKARRMKRRKSLRRSGQFSHSSSLYNPSGRAQVFPQTGQTQLSSAQVDSTFDTTFKSEMRERTDSAGSKDGTGFTECVFRPCTPVQADEAKPTESSGLDERMSDMLRSDYCDEQTTVPDGGCPCYSGKEKIDPCSSDATWDEKPELLDPMELNTKLDESPDMCESVELTGLGLNSETIKPPCELLRISDLHDKVERDKIETNDQLHNRFEAEGRPKPSVERHQLDEVDSETDNFVDALNTIESESETDFDYQAKRVESCTNSEVQFVGDEEQMAGSIDNNLLHSDSPSECYLDRDGQFHSFRNSTSLCLSQQVSLEHSPLSCNYPNSEPIDDSSSPSRLFTEQSMQGELSNLNDSSLSGQWQHAQPTRECSVGQLSHHPGVSVSSLNVIHEKSRQGEGCHLYDTTSSRLPPGEESLQLATSSCVSPDELSHSAANPVLRGPLVHDPSLQSMPVSPVIASTTEADTTSSKLAPGEESLQLATTPCVYPDEPAIQSRENAVLAESLHRDSSLQNAQVSSVACSFPVIASICKADTVDGLRPQKETDEFVSSGAEVSSVKAPPIAERTSGACSAVKGTAAQSSGVYPSTFWTNGGLLGLAPSKPPDLNSSNNLNNGSIGANYSNRYENPVFKGEESRGRLLQCDDIEKSEVERSNDAVINGDSKTHSQAKLLDVAADATSATPDLHHASASNSSMLSGIGRGLLMDGFQKYLSSSLDKPEAGQPPKPCDAENGLAHARCNSFPGRDSSKQLNSPEMSPPPSPPLEHMSISFQPLHGFQSSKLKLAYPEGITQYEEGLDTFPSFQLVPEPAMLRHDVGSDSDDDTFCRSRACLSDDCLSHLSDSNSEFWESGDSLESKEHSIYDGLCENTSESFSTSPKNGEVSDMSFHADCNPRLTETGRAQSLSGASLDLPVLDSVNPFSHDTKASENLELLESLKTLELTPEPPPLPPLQWRVSQPQSNSDQDKPNSDQDKQTSFSVILSQFSKAELSGSPISRPAKPVKAKLISTTEQAVSVAHVGKQHLDEPKQNGRKNGIQTDKGRKQDEKEDFLQQIRSKSFNLRRTDTARPASKIAPTASFKVTAILEKANAIRQAVASDDGEETDTWSDT